MHLASGFKCQKCLQVLLIDYCLDNVLGMVVSHTHLQALGLGDVFASSWLNNMEKGLCVE